MSPRSGRVVAGAFIVAAAVAAIGAALVYVGSPGEARQLRFDEERASDPDQSCEQDPLRRRMAGAAGLPGAERARHLGHDPDRDPFHQGSHAPGGVERGGERGGGRL